MCPHCQNNGQVIAQRGNVEPCFCEAGKAVAKSMRAEAEAFAILGLKPAGESRLIKKQNTGSQDDGVL